MTTSCASACGSADVGTADRLGSYSLGAHLAADFRRHRFRVRNLKIRVTGAEFPAEDGLRYQFEDGSAVLGDYFQPCQAAQHGEIDTAEAEAREEDVDAVAQRLVVERVDGVRQGIRAVGVRPSVIHFGV